MSKLKRYSVITIAVVVTFVAVGLYTKSPTADAQVAKLFKTDVPPGTIVLWFGPLSAIPNGFVLCDGTNGTPNLLDRFVLSVGAGENPGATGGESTHTHAGTTVPGAGHHHLISRGEGTGPQGSWVESALYGTTTVSGVSAEHSQNFDGTYNNASLNGSNQVRLFRTSEAVTPAENVTIGAASNVPPFMKLAYIMKT